MPFENVESVELYEKSPGKYYLLSASREGSERLVYSEEDGIKKKCAPEEIVRQLYIKELITRYRYPKELIEIEKHVNIKFYGFLNRSAKYHSFWYCFAR